MEKGERLTQAIDYLKKTGKAKTLDDIANVIQRSKTNISSAANGNHRYLTDKFLSHFNMCYDNIFSLKWLITGEGDMLSSTSSAQPQPSVKNERVVDDEAYKVPLVPISALAGSLNDFSLSVKRDDCETVISPIKDIDMAIKISGDSMEPEYPSDSQVFIKKVNERAFLEWGRVYVLNTCNGIVIKRLMPTNDPNTVLCESINPKYPPFEVNLENVNGVYRVIMCMSFK
jgi:phage repressor protein C with HTH and peptisase S24 domain